MKSGIVVLDYILPNNICLAFNRSPCWTRWQSSIVLLFSCKKHFLDQKIIHLGWLYNTSTCHNSLQLPETEKHTGDL